MGNFKVSNTAQIFINRELEKWENRVIFNVKFKEDTTANLDRLDQILKKSMEKFTVIAANSEQLVYKIGRHFITRSVKNDEITFIDGNVIASYIGDDSAEWKKKERADEFFQIFGETYKNKWVLIPFMTFPISVGLAVYFITKFKKYGAIGLVLYSEGVENITEMLSLNVDDPNFYEYPKKRYRRNKRILPEDDY